MGEGSAALSFDGSEYVMTVKAMFSHALLKTLQGSRPDFQLKEFK